MYDFIIVGSGFGGSVAALRLSEKGYSILVLEKGKRYTPADFPKTNWRLRKYLWLPALGFYGFQKLAFYPQASIMSGVGVGGGSLVYANTLFHPPDEFFNHPSWKEFADWKEALGPYYEKAAFMMGRTKYDRMNPEDLLLKQVAGEMGRSETFDQVHIGVYLDGESKEKDPYFKGLGPLRKPCTECAGCMVGCREDAKNSLDKNYLYFAEKMGAEIRAETKAVRIEYRQGEYRVATRSSTSTVRRKTSLWRSRGIIFAGGTLGTMELLLKQKHRYKTLPGLSDLLGTGVLTNSETLCSVSSIPEKMNNGLAITSVFNPDDITHVEIVKYPDRSNALKIFFWLSASVSKLNFLRFLNLLGNILGHPLKFLKMAFDMSWSTNLVIFLVMQHIENAMYFKWKNGLFGGRLRIVNKGRKKVPAYIDIGQKTMEKYAEISGGIAQNIILEVLFNRPTTAHILGGCPMGKDSGSGVVDPGLKVHGYENMYIVDGSVIQGNIGVNPSYTILSMAEYAMDRIPEKAGNKMESLQKQMGAVS